MAQTTARLMEGRQSRSPASPGRAAGQAGPSRPWCALFSTFVVLGVVARIWPRGALWLDEAQSVAIARLPLSTIPDALREDGAPPLYYVVLHGWMALFGEGDAAVRALSVVCSLLALVAITAFAWRLAGRRGAWAAAVLFATSPFVVRYASEARMYALVMLEVAIGLLALLAARRRGAWRALVLLAVITAALLSTHYWSMYLVVVVVATLAVVARRSAWARPAVVAVLAGVVAWLPWLPTFAFQAERTATPWSEAPNLRSPLAVFDVGLRGSGALPVLLGIAVGLLVVAAVWTQRTGAVRFLAVALVGTLAVALAGATASGSAFASRYTSVVVPILLVLAAIGVTGLRRRIALPAVAVMAAIGLVLSIDEISTPRTRSEAFVAPLVAQASAGDLVVYCPDQLGPAATRLLDDAGLDGLRQLSFPPRSRPERVDWIDYAERYADADPRDFADDVDRAHPTSVIWLVWSGTYPPTQPACNGLFRALSRQRADRREVVADDPSLSDHGALWRFDP